jgi:hypothetical protein
LHGISRSFFSLQAVFLAQTHYVKNGRPKRRPRRSGLSHTKEITRLLLVVGLSSAPEESEMLLVTFGKANTAGL